MKLILALIILVAMVCFIFWIAYAVKEYLEEKSRLEQDMKSREARRKRKGK